MNTRSTMDNLNKMLEAAEACYVTVAKANGLTYNALMLLLMVDGHEHLTQKQVCEALHLPKSSVHSILAGLMERGCLTLAEGGNKKEKYIVLTASGASLIKKVVSETEQMEHRTLESLSEQEMTSFMRTAQRLTSRLEKEAAALYERSV